MRVAATSAPAGASAEFGVFTGRSLDMIAQFRKPPRFGFDCWTGLPEDWDTGLVKHEAGHFACTKPTGLAHGTKLVDGWFQESLPTFLAGRDVTFAFVHIDCDLFSATEVVLREIEPRLAPGAVLLFDELCNFDDSYPLWREGEWRALVEWLAATGRKVRPIARTDHQQVAFVLED